MKVRALSLSLCLAALPAAALAVNGLVAPPADTLWPQWQARIAVQTAALSPLGLSAPGYPACPDHRPKRELFRVLDAERIGMGLTESLAMTPASSVSDFYLAHPEARYFNVGPIGNDQLADWAARCAIDEAAARRALAPQLG